MQQQKATRMIAAASLAAMLVGGSALVRAQPAHPPGPEAGGMTAIVLDATVHTALALTAAQEAQWQALSAAATALRTSIETARTAVHDAVTAELAKAIPDLGAIDATFDAARASEDAAVKAFHLQALAFYATLSTGQQATVIAAVKAITQRADGQPPRRP